MARSRRIDLARLSILALVEAFAAVMAAALTRTPDAPAPDLARWAAWIVMAAQLTELRSRLLLPADAPEARAAQSEAEALRQRWIWRAETAAATDWLAERPQLGFEVFARGRLDAFRAEPPELPPASGGEIAAAEDWAAAAADERGGDEAGEDSTARANATSSLQDERPVAGGDLTDLLRACLAALRLPLDAGAYQPRALPFWKVSDAAARIARLLDSLPDGVELGTFLPKIAGGCACRALHCRAAVAATIVAALELTRDGAVRCNRIRPGNLSRFVAARPMWHTRAPHRQRQCRCKCDPDADPRRVLRISDRCGLGRWRPEPRPGNRRRRQRAAHSERAAASRRATSPRQGDRRPQDRSSSSSTAAPCPRGQ